MVAVNEKEGKVLEFFSEELQDDHFSPFAPIASYTRLNRKEVRRACRSLRKKGLAEFMQGLWNEDGEPCGSGYRATREGLEIVRKTIGG